MRNRAAESGCGRESRIHMDRIVITAEFRKPVEIVLHQGAFENDILARVVHLLGIQQVFLNLAGGSAWKVSDRYEGLWHLVGR